MLSLFRPLILSLLLVAPILAPASESELRASSMMSVLIERTEAALRPALLVARRDDPERLMEFAIRSSCIHVGFFEYERAFLHVLERTPLNIDIIAERHRFGATVVIIRRDYDSFDLFVPGLTNAVLDEIERRREAATWTTSADNLGITARDIHDTDLGSFYAHCNEPAFVRAVRAQLTGTDGEAVTVNRQPTLVYRGWQPTEMGGNTMILVPMDIYSSSAYAGVGLSQTNMTLRQFLTGVANREDVDLVGEVTTP